MARMLENLPPGTPVYLGDRCVGSVRGVYAEGNARLAEYLLVEWSASSTQVLLPTKDVESLEEKGAILMGEDPRRYDDIPAFDEASYPTIRKIA